MKACSYCGRENADAAEFCSGCGTQFRSDLESASSGLAEPLNEKSPLFQFSQQCVSPWIKWLFWLMAWGFVVLFTVSEHPEDLRETLAFPLGLCGLLPIRAAIGIAMLVALPVVVIGWAIYLRLAMAMKKAKTAGHFSLLYFLFCVLLVLNVGGCRKLIATAAKIE